LLPPSQLERSVLARSTDDPPGDRTYRRWDVASQERRVIDQFFQIGGGSALNPFDDQLLQGYNA
jgi:hypothetical protein